MVHSGIVEHDDGLNTDQRAVDTKDVWRQYFLEGHGGRRDDNAKDAHTEAAHVDR
jgi:hypothetical protein